jgi:hypothetical protein
VPRRACERGVRVGVCAHGRVCVAGTRARTGTGMRSGTPRVCGGLRALRSRPRARKQASKQPASLPTATRDHTPPRQRRTRNVAMKRATLVADTCCGSGSHTGAGGRAPPRPLLLLLLLLLLPPSPPPAVPQSAYTAANSCWCSSKGCSGRNSCSVSSRHTCGG